MVFSKLFMFGSIAPATMLGSGQWLWRFGRESSEREEIESERDKNENDKSV